MRLLLYATLSVFSFFSCNIINPDEGIPGYVKVNSVTMEAGGAQGTSSSNISEVWMYVNDNMTGAFSMPTAVPVLGEGSTRITCFGGIKNNGIGSLRIRYPFYAAYDTTVNVQPNTDVLLHPKFEYVSGLDIDASRNFESKTNFEEVTGEDIDFEITTDPDIVKEGGGSGQIIVPAGISYYQFVDSEFFTFTAGNTVFLEMDYSCNNSITIGCYAIDGLNTNKIGVLTLLPTTSGSGAVWNKIYLDFGALGLINPGTDYYKMYLEGGPYESTTPTYYFDNLKLVKFQE